MPRSRAACENFRRNRPSRAACAPIHSGEAGHGRGSVRLIAEAARRFSKAASTWSASAGLLNNDWRRASSGDGGGNAAVAGQDDDRCRGIERPQLRNQIETADRQAFANRQAQDPGCGREQVAKPPPRCPRRSPPNSAAPARGTGGCGKSRRRRSPKPAAFPQREA